MVINNIFSLFCNGCASNVNFLDRNEYVAFCTFLLSYYMVVFFHFAYPLFFKFLQIC